MPTKKGTRKKAAPKKMAMVPVLNGQGKCCAAVALPTSGGAFKISGQGTAGAGTPWLFRNAARDFRNVGKALAPVASFVAPKIPALINAVKSNAGNPFAMGIAGARALTGLGRKPRASKRR